MDGVWDAIVHTCKHKLSSDGAVVRSGVQCIILYKCCRLTTLSSSTTTPDKEQILRPVLSGPVQSSLETEEASPSHSTIDQHFGAGSQLHSSCTGVNALQPEDV